MAKMQALQLHSYHGKDYKPGATYDADDGDVNTIEVQGKGARVDASQKPAEKAQATAAKSKPVEPMTTKNTAALKPKAKAKARK